MAQVTRVEIHASPEDLYRKSLEDRLAAARKKTWAEMTPEEKDLIAEAVGFHLGHVKAP